MVGDVVGNEVEKIVGDEEGLGVGKASSLKRRWKQQRTMTNNK